MCQIISKAMHKCRSNVMDHLSLRSFDHLTLKCDLGLQLTCINVSSGTFSLSGKQMPHFFFKSMNKCRGNGFDKFHLMTIQEENSYFPISGADNSTVTDCTKGIS